MPRINNQGVYVSGGNVQIGQLAQGDGARAEQTIHPAAPQGAGDWAQLAGQAEALALAIGNSAARLEEAAAAVRAARELAGEAVKREPQPAKARGLVDRLLSACAPAADLLQVAAGLSELLRSLGG